MRKFTAAVTVLAVVSGCGASADTATSTSSSAGSTTTSATSTVAPTSSSAGSTTTSATSTLVPTTTTTVPEASVDVAETTPIYDYRLDDANVLNHLRPDNEACLYRALGDATLQALQTRPMDPAESEGAMHCLGHGAESGQLVDPPLPGVDPPQPGVDPPLPGVDPPLPGVDPPQPGVDPPLPGVDPPQPGVDPPQAAGNSWEGPTICTSHGVFYQPPAFGVAVGQPLADPTAAVLDDGRVRLYAFAQGVGIVSAVSDDGRMFTEETGVRIPGTEAGQPRIWRLPDGRWRMYVSKVREIASFTSDDGLDFIKDPGDRLTAQAAGLAAISSPSIVEIEPGLWRMYYSTLAVPGTGPGGKRSGSATSADLLEWTVDPGWRLGEGAPYLTDSAEHPFPVIAADGSVSLFYGKFRASSGGAPDGLWRATSDDGLTFTDEAYTGLYFGNDPEVLLLASGERIIYYGDFDPTIGGKLLSATCVQW